MSFVFPTNASQVQAFAGALYGVQVGTTTMAQVNADIAANGGLASTLNSYYSATFGGATTASVATTVATNLGLTGDALTSGAAYVEAQLNAAAPAARGAVISSIVNLFANLSADATFGAAASAWNTKVTTAVSYAGTDNVAIGTVVATSAVFSLTAGTDIAGVSTSSQSGATSTFKFSSGNETIEAMTASMQAADTLIDSTATGDVDVINILATGAMNALTAVNVETANVNFASGTPTAVFTNFSGLDTVNVTGSVAGTVTDAEAAMINVTGYTRVVTINETLIDGTSAAGNADVMNITVSGVTHGSTTATRSGVTLTAGTAGTLETLNITSAGTADNDFTLDASTNVTLSTVNVTGSTAATVRVANADLTGLTFNATTAGDVTLVVDRTGLTTTATNANLWTGVDDLRLIDSASPAVGGDGGSVSGLKVGQKITFANDFNASVLAFSNATGSTDTATIVLDNTTAVTDTDVAQINAQNIETLVITSSGFATSTSTTAENLIDDLVGDATTITVGGDTSLDLDLNIDAATSGTRTVVVDASSNTAFVNIEAAAGAGASSTITVAYNITGTAGNDTLSLNTTGGTLAGGAGNDSLTGSALNDTISTGAGTDTVFATTGTDTVTFGDGVDTIIYGEADVTGVAQVSTLTPTGFDGGLIQVVINGTPYQTAFATDIATSIDNFLTANATAILANHGVTASDGTTALVLTGASTGASFTITYNFGDGGVQTAGTVTATTAAVAAVSVATTIVDFSSTDVISFDISEMNGVTGIESISDSTNDVVGGDDVVITDYSGTAVTMAAGANVIKVGYSNAINSSADVLALIDAGNITTAAALTLTNGGDSIVTIFYDADASAMVVGLLEHTDNAAAIDDNTIFNEIAIVGMTSAQFTALTASNFSFVA